MSRDPKVEAALEAARIRSETMRARYPMMQDEEPAQAPPTRGSAPDHMAPPRAPTPAAPPASGSLQMASYDALLREVERRKQEAVKQLQDLQIQPQMLEVELKLRNLPPEVREKLKEIPTDVIVDELGLLKKAAV